MVVRRSILRQSYWPPRRRSEGVGGTEINKRGSGIVAAIEELGTRSSRVVGVSRHPPRLLGPVIVFAPLSANYRCPRSRIKLQMQSIIPSPHAVLTYAWNPWDSSVPPPPLVPAATRIHNSIRQSLRRCKQTYSSLAHPPHALHRRTVLGTITISLLDQTSQMHAWISAPSPPRVQPPTTLTV